MQKRIFYLLFKIVVFSDGVQMSLGTETLHSKEPIYLNYTKKAELQLLCPCLTASEHETSNL